MRVALKREKRVNRRDRYRIAARHTDFPPLWPIDRGVADRRTARGHDRRSGHGLRVHLERPGEVAGAERRFDVAHVRPNFGDVGSVGRVRPVEHHAAAVGKIFKDMRGCVLVHAHDVCAARLHRREVVLIVRTLAGTNQSNECYADR